MENENGALVMALKEEFASSLPSAPDSRPIQDGLTLDSIWTIS